MTLGELIGAMRDEARVGALLAISDDAEILAEIGARAESEGIEPGEMASEIVGIYSASASSEEWTTMIGLIARAGDPGAALLKRALIYTRAKA